MKQRVMNNTILDVSGLRIGQAHDANVKTGVTVILPDMPATCAVDVRGGGPGTRETDTLSDGGLIEQVHAICLSGGSVYGLAAADGVCAWLGSRRIGYVSGPEPIPVSPIVPSAILFDNANGGDKDWGIEPPFRTLAIQACGAASNDITLGKSGAGFGATAGLYPGGIGSASETVDGITVGAIIAANPIGLKAAGQSTVIGAVATNAKLCQKKLKRLAIMAQDGIAMAVQPSHTPLDGDTIFALSTGDKPCESPVALAELSAAAARCVARALMRGVHEASK